MATRVRRWLLADVPPNVRRYYVYKATKAVEFYRPIMYIFLLEQDLSFAQIAILEAIYNLATVLGEVPTGYVGDRVGRRNSLLLGTALIALVLVGIGLAETFPAFAVLYAAWSMGYNFRSGSEDAWLYDTLTAELTADAFARVRGRGESASLAVGAIAAVLGGYLGSVDLSLPWFVAAAVTSLGVVVVFAFDEPARTGTGDGTDADGTVVDQRDDTSETDSTPDDQRDDPAETDSDDGEPLGFRQALGVVRDVLSRRHVRALVVYYYVLYAAVTYLVFVFLQPVFETVVVDVGVPRPRVESLLGWFYAAYSLVGAVLSYYTGWIESRIGLRAWFVALPFVVGGALMGMLAVPVLAIPTFLFARGLADVTRSLAAQYLNDRIDSVGRATVLSAMAMVSGLTVVPFQLASGKLADVTSPLVALAVAGGVLVVGSTIILAWELPVAERTRDGSSR